MMSFFAVLPVLLMLAAAPALRAQVQEPADADKPAQAGALLVLPPAEATSVEPKAEVPAPKAKKKAAKKKTARKAKKAPEAKPEAEAPKAAESPKAVAAPPAAPLPPAVPATPVQPANP